MTAENPVRRMLAWSCVSAALSGAAILLIPLWSERLLWLFALIFWGLILAAYVCLARASAIRRKSEDFRKAPARIRNHRPGIISPSSSPAVRGLTALSLAALAVFVVLQFVHHKSQWPDFALAAFVLAALQIRCLLSGKNAAYLIWKKRSAKKRGAKAGSEHGEAPKAKTTKTAKDADHASPAHSRKTGVKKQKQGGKKNR